MRRKGSGPRSRQQMSELRDFRLATWVAVAAALTLPAEAHAQQTKPKQTAAKSTAKPAAAPAAQAALGGAQPNLLGQYGDWGAYAANAAGTKVCFALARPQEAKTSPPGKPRDPTYLFIATRPSENVRNEVSVAIGYAFKSGTDATIEIGPAKFAMYTQSDGAWIKNAAEETRMVEAMRKGTDLTVTGTSTRGTHSTDRYTLKGLSQALDRAAQECK
jgi:invasion protein IalB